MGLGAADTGQVASAAGALALRVLPRQPELLLDGDAVRAHGHPAEGARPHHGVNGLRVVRQHHVLGLAARADAQPQDVPRREEAELPGGVGRENALRPLDPLVDRE